MTRRRAAIATVVVALIGWIVLILSTPGEAEWRLPFAEAATIGAWVLPVAGLLLGVFSSAAAMLLRPSASSTDPAPPWYAATLVSVVGAFLLICVGVARGTVDPVAGALILLLGTAAAAAAAQAARKLSGDRVSFDSHWGGLGGAQGGWSVSPATSLVLLSLILVAATVTVATGRAHRDPASAGQGPSKDDVKTEAVAAKQGSPAAADGTKAGPP